MALIGEKTWIKFVLLETILSCSIIMALIGEKTWITEIRPAVPDRY